MVWESNGRANFQLTVVTHLPQQNELQLWTMFPSKLYLKASLWIQWSESDLMNSMLTYKKYASSSHKALYEYLLPHTKEKNIFFRSFKFWFFTSVMWHDTPMKRNALFSVQTLGPRAFFDKSPEKKHNANLFLAHKMSVDAWSQRLEARQTYNF